MTLMCDLKRLQCHRAMAKKIEEAPAAEPVEKPAPEAEKASKRRRRKKQLQPQGQLSKKTIATTKFSKIPEMSTTIIN